MTHQVWLVVIFVGVKWACSAYQSVRFDDGVLCLVESDRILAIEVQVYYVNLRLVVESGYELIRQQWL